jgi:hypothetical protein
MRNFLAILALSVLTVSGCRAVTGRDDVAREVESDVRNFEGQVRESRTLSNLAKIEASLADYIKLEKRIPEKLEWLIPKYLAEIPSVDLGLKGHEETSLVKVYPADVLRDGQISGTRILDTGKWGYVFNDRQVVVFVDCTHKSSRGRPWYQERGVY